ncbi:MAG: family NAD(P)-dependent oxidoreductase [Massilia sp.]|nr:family NAD(P)-dependent oxidoreductase [Massilia sp.]
MILLIGATGTIGRTTMAALRAANVAFKVAARNPAELHALGVPSVAFDWDQLSSYLPALQGVDRLFLLTPNSERQVGYMLQAVAAAKRAGVRHIVRVSVMGADAEPGIILGRQHAAAEREIRAGGIGWTMLRPTFFMDNFVRYYGVDPHQDSQVYLPNGDGKAAWVDPADVGEVAARVLCTGSGAGSVIDLTGPELLSTAEVLAVLGSVLGQRYTYVDASEQAAREAMEKTGMPAWLVDAFLELNALIRQGHAATLASGVQQVLGRPPRSMREWAARVKTAPGTA